MLTKLDRKKLLILGVILFLVLVVCGAIALISQSTTNRNNENESQSTVEIEEQSSTSSAQSSTQSTTTSISSSSTSSSTTTSFGLKNVEFVVGDYASNGQPIQAGEINVTLQMPDNPSFVINTSDKSKWELTGSDFVFNIRIPQGESAGGAFTAKRGEVNHPKYGLIYLMDNYFVTGSRVKLTGECHVGFVNKTYPAPCTAYGASVSAEGPGFNSQCITKSESGIQSCLDILRTVTVSRTTR